MNFNNFTIKSQEAVQKAIELAQANNQPVSYTHLQSMRNLNYLINFHQHH